MELADETNFPHKGYINFGNNIVNPSTGTMTLRRLENPGNAWQTALRPGMFVRVRLPLGKPHPALLVADQAIGTDQNNKYLLSVDDKNKVDYRRITPGPLEEGGLRVVDGIKADEWIIVSGLQMVRPGQEVKIDPQPMPVTGGQQAPNKTPEPATNKEADGKKEPAAPKAGDGKN